MQRFRKFLALGKQHLPRAFTKGGPLPFSEASRPIPATATNEEVARRMEELLPTGDEDLKEFSQANAELGFDEFAFYVSFHRPSPSNGWGIFYWDHRVRQLAQSLREFAGNLVYDPLSPQTAAAIALEILRRHEMFHFRFDAYALNQELTIGRPLYNRYFANVYRHVHCTDQCYEEALANRACVCSQYNPRTFGRTPFQENIHARDIQRFVRQLCQNSPPGYRDFGRSEKELQRYLGGQLLYGKAKAVLPEPRGWWVGLPVPNWRRGSCPEYVLWNGTVTPRDVVHFRVKRRGYVWDFHKNDPDHWPSQPHGHDYDRNYKLDLGNGKVYLDNRKEKAVDRLDRKLLEELRELAKKRWPDVRLPELRV